MSKFWQKKYTSKYSGKEIDDAIGQVIEGGDGLVVINNIEGGEYPLYTDKVLSGSATVDDTSTLYVPLIDQDFNLLIVSESDFNKIKENFRFIIETIVESPKASYFMFPADVNAESYACFNPNDTTDWKTNGSFIILGNGTADILIVDGYNSTQYAIVSATYNLVKSESTGN